MERESRNIEHVPKGDRKLPPTPPSSIEDTSTNRKGIIYNPCRVWIFFCRRCTLRTACIATACFLYIAAVIILGSAAVNVYLGPKRKCDEIASECKRDKPHQRKRPWDPCEEAERCPARAMIIVLASFLAALMEIAAGSLLCVTIFKYKSMLGFISAGCTLVAAIFIPISISLEVVLETQTEAFTEQTPLYVEQLQVGSAAICIFSLAFHFYHIVCIIQLARQINAGEYEENPYKVGGNGQIQPDAVAGRLNFWYNNRYQFNNLKSKADRGGYHGTIGAPGYYATPGGHPPPIPTYF